MLSRRPDALLESSKSQLRPLLIRGAVAMTKWHQRMRGRPSSIPDDPTISVVGFHETASGLGFAARGVVRALAERSPQSVSLSELSRTPCVETPLGSVVTPRSPRACRADVAIHVYNPDIFLAAVRRFGTRFLRAGRVNVALAIWETETLPPLWAEVLSLYDAICTHSRFAAGAFEKGTSRPVAIIPPCLPERPVRIRYSEKGPFVFLAMFDHFSCVERKNPVGAVRAFRRALAGLPPGSARMRIKCHSGTPSEVLGRLREEFGDAPIEIVDRTLDDTGMESLWQECDCLISLHRSEGYGLPVAEALSRGIPVIATRQGGILDFTDENSYLVAGKPLSAAAAEGNYVERSGWLEPDLAEAAAHIRSVVLDHERAIRRAEAARRHIQSTTSPRAVQATFDSVLRGFSDSVREC